jgi:hypothetical protein
MRPSKGRREKSLFHDSASLREGKRSMLPSTDAKEKGGDGFHRAAFL